MVERSRRLSRNLGAARSSHLVCNCLQSSQNFHSKFEKIVNLVVLPSVEKRVCFEIGAFRGAADLDSKKIARLMM